MRKRLRNGAGRDTTATLGVAKEVLDPAWNIVCARASVMLLGRYEEVLLRGYVARVAKGTIGVEDREDHFVQRGVSGGGKLTVRGAVEGGEGAWRAFFILGTGTGVTRRVCPYGTWTHSRNWKLAYAHTGQAWTHKHPHLETLPLWALCLAL
jgi:hypothetical protein